MTAHNTCHGCGGLPVRTNGLEHHVICDRRWKLAQDRFNEVFGESAAAKLRATLLRIARDERLATLTD
jgi:hypothetical protein